MPDLAYPVITERVVIRERGDRTGSRRNRLQQG